MDKKKVQGVVVILFAGALFLRAILSGGVASEETAMVLNAMRSLRRVDNVAYYITSNYANNADIEGQTQYIWVDFLTGTWAAEYQNTDSDGTLTYLQTFCDGKNVMSSQAGAGWEQDYSFTTEIPNLSAITNLPYGVDDIAETVVSQEENGQKITISLTEEHLQEQKEEALAYSRANIVQTSGGDSMDAYYEQYEKTHYENVNATYTLDSNGVLTGMEYSFELVQPKLVTDSEGTRVSGQRETFQMTVSVAVSAYNDTAITDTIAEFAADAGYDK